MKHSKQFNKNSYEAKMLWSQIRNWTYDLDTINEMITAIRTMLKDYIETKEHLYQHIRKQRQIGQD